MESNWPMLEIGVNVTHVVWCVGVGGGCCWCEPNCELNSNLLFYQIITYCVYYTIHLLHHNYIHLVALCRAYQFIVSTTLCWPSTTSLTFNHELFSLGTHLTWLCIFRTWTNVLWHSLSVSTSDMEESFGSCPWTWICIRTILKHIFVLFLYIYIFMTRK